MQGLKWTHSHPESLRSPEIRLEDIVVILRVREGEATSLHGRSKKLLSTASGEKEDFQGCEALPHTLILQGPDDIKREGVGIARPAAGTDLVIKYYQEKKSLRNVKQEGGWLAPICLKSEEL